MEILILTALVSLPLIAFALRPSLRGRRADGKTPDSGAPPGTTPLDARGDTALGGAFIGASMAHRDIWDEEVINQTFGVSAREDDSHIDDPTFAHLPGNIYHHGGDTFAGAGISSLADDWTSTGTWQGDREFMEPTNIFLDPSYFWMDGNAFHHDMDFSSHDSLISGFDHNFSSGSLFDDSFSSISSSDDLFGSGKGSFSSFDDW